MNCALAAVGFISGDLEYNKHKILDTMQQYAATADVILFGEAFLQGFYGTNFEAAHDEQIAVAADSTIIQEIRIAAKQYGIAVSFGFIEKDGHRFYSSQITINRCGEIIDLFRRVSPGWKEAYADDHYCEGNNFHTFLFLGRRIAIGLCGDLWYEENAAKMRALSPDILFWPVYTDFLFSEWNTCIKLEYAAQAKLLGRKVLYVNSYCLDGVEGRDAQGGAALFEDGQIAKEIPPGQESVLLVEV